MKKFLTYFSVSAVVIIAGGCLIIFGVFDTQLGQLNLVGSSGRTFDPAQVHNTIVEKIHNIGINIKKASDLFNEITAENTDLTKVKKEIENIYSKKEELVKFINTNEFNNNKADTLAVFNDTYLPALEYMINTFTKATTYFNDKGIDEENLNSFKGLIKIGYNEMVEAHNTFSVTLND